MVLDAVPARKKVTFTFDGKVIEGLEGEPIAVARGNSGSGRKRVCTGTSRPRRIGFMGFPLLQSLVGTNGLFYGTAYNSIFGLFLWTHGFSLFSEVLNKKTMYKIVLNPNIISSIIGLSFYRFSIALPMLVDLTIGYLAQLNTALSMVVIGATMTQIPLKKLYADVYIWIGVTVRNLVLPFTLLFLLYIAGVRGELLLCSIIPAACPVAGFSVLF